jgi:sporulation related protein
MKDKDPNEDEFNKDKDEQDNINEADDSFGLPDLDFNTLDEASEEADETEPESSEEPEAAADSEDTSTEDEGSESTSAEENDVIADGETEEPELEDTNEDPPVRSYVPPKPESNAPKVIAAIVVTILVTVGIWYFMFYRPQAAAAEKARIEAVQAKKDADAKIAAEKKRIAEQEKLAAEQATNQAADEDEATLSEATFSTISEPTGRYYIVIESFIDSDMATDYGNELAKKGIASALLSPKGERNFHRLTIGDYGTFLEAQEEANKLKAEFGDDLWVLKY